MAFVSAAGQSFYIGLFGPTVQAALGIDTMRWGLLYGLATMAGGDGAASTGAAGAWLWSGLYAGLGATAGGQSVLSGALRAEAFGPRAVGLVRGVDAAVMVLATAMAPPLLGGLLDGGVPPAALLYVAAVPARSARRLRRAMASSRPALPWDRAAH